jgi:hypothetical protein
LSSMDCSFDRNLSSLGCTLSSMDCTWASWIVLFSCKVLRQNA